MLMRRERNRLRTSCATAVGRGDFRKDITDDHIILQNQTLMDCEHPSTIIVPLTTRLIADADPLRLRIPARERLLKDSDVLIDQIRAIDNQRLIDGPLTRLTQTEMACLMSFFTEILG